MKKIFETIGKMIANYKSNKLHKMLLNNVVTFVYTKKDGTMRIATGTLLKQFVESVENKHSGRKPNPSLQVYFDTEKNAFRSFSKSSLVKIVGVA